MELEIRIFGFQNLKVVNDESGINLNNILGGCHLYEIIRVI